MSLIKLFVTRGRGGGTTNWYSLFLRATEKALTVYILLEVMKMNGLIKNSSEARIWATL